jgi:hypothetical protein
MEERSNQQYDLSSALLVLIKGATPERSGEIEGLWAHYNPKVLLVNDSTGITLKADGEAITFDAKTPKVFWLIGFSAWHAIECYAPHVIVSARTNTPIRQVLADDAELGVFERDFKERLAAAQAIIDEKDYTALPWPPDVPEPVADRNELDGEQAKAAYDLTTIAVAFTILHEFRHVMLDQDELRPRDLREEELQCDVWARGFITAKLEAYAQANGHDYHEVLQKRSMALAVAAFILYLITPSWDHGGNKQYFSISTRISAVLDNTGLSDDSHFWVQAAAYISLAG